MIKQDDYLIFVVASVIMILAFLVAATFTDTRSVKGDCEASIKHRVTSVKSTQP